MTYFNNLNKVLYEFGDEVTSSVFQNLTLYADMIDDLKDASSFHEKYTIQQGERPDQVSLKFYDTTEHYWTFYLLNDHIRLQGWPLSSRKLEEKVKAQIFTCWSVPIGLPFSEDLLVRVKLQLKPDGTIEKLEMLDHVKMNTPGKEKFRTLADSVRRAIQLCNPLKVPSSGYER